MRTVLILPKVRHVKFTEVLQKKVITSEIACGPHDGVVCERYNVQHMIMKYKALKGVKGQEEERMPQHENTIPASASAEISLAGDAVLNQ